MPNDVYLSSTLGDLVEERNAARDVLSQHGFGVKDSYQASEKELVTSCLDDVAKCAIYVCIVGMRYGYRPVQDNPQDKSITQLEFERAQQKNLPCFVFVKAEEEVKLIHSDDHTRENGAGERIRQFRDWVATQAGIRSTRFRDIRELREKLLGAVLVHQQHKAGSGLLLRTEGRHLAEMTADVGLVLHPGSSQPLLGEYRRQIAQDRRFKALELAPDDPLFLQRLDEVARDCRALCWLLSPDVVASYRDHPGVLARALRDQGRRRGGAAALLVGNASPLSLPADWSFAAVEEADLAPATALNDVFAALRARVRSIRPDRRIGIPCLVFAMTGTEARAMLDRDALLAAVADPVEREVRRTHLARMLAALRQPGVQPAWPDQSYGEQREQWRPFGPATPTADDYLREAVEQLNDGEPSKRERLFIKASGLRLQLLPYSLDELTDDFRGSQAAVLAVRDRGCIVLVDEMALLHPALRRWARTLLKSENVAVLCSQPVDPAPYPVSAALAKDSALQIGSLMTRFRDQHDPRCEVAINSPQRLQRWLRLVLPELVPALDGAEVQTALVNRSDEELFGRKVPV